MERLNQTIDTPQAGGESRTIELYLVVLYAGLDWLFRQGGLSFMQGMWDELLFIGIVGLWILRIAINRWQLRRSSLLLPFLLYLSIMIFLVMVNSPDNRVALEGMRVMVEYVLWFFVGYQLLSSRNQARNLVDVFLILMIVIALIGVFQYITGAEMPGNWVDKAEQAVKSRAFSIIGSPNILGSLMVLAVPIAYSMYYVSEQWFKKLVYAGATFILALCLVVTLSRGAWLAIIVSLLFLWLWVDKRIIIVMILVAVLTPALLPDVSNRITYALSPEYVVAAEKGGRLGRWDTTLKYWQNAPALGVGLGQFGGAVAARYFPEDSFYVDSWYLKVGVETGWVGLGATLLLILTGLRRARSSLNQTDDHVLKIMGLGILAGLVGVLAHNCVENVFEVPMMASYFWFLLGMVAAFSQLQTTPPGDME